ncbi:MAG: penicillin acylase family protein [Ardenticatenaceae bacterium]|nr:penicillin acylase family protein [Ardenticatenaceae bacterium]
MSRKKQRPAFFSRLPQVNGRIYHRALHHPVTIRRDRWGVPHIHAASRHDLFFAQGFVHAQDRLWQMEINRRAASGTLSALLGPLTLDTDRLSRALGFARLAAQSWQSLDEASRADVLAYTAGVNALLETTSRLPLEFALLRHHPAPWQPLDTIAYGRLQMWALTNGAMGEMVTAQLNDRVGAALAAELLPEPPPENPVTLPQGIEVNWRGTAVSPFLGKGGDGAGRGSNAWVISGDHTTTGQPILANDMHLPLGTPSLWYFVHLRSDDGWHVSGFSQPGLPYVLVGRNAHIAWGATLAYTDCEDLFVEEFHPHNPALYRSGDAWRTAQTITETIPIRTRPPHTEHITLTHHGPLLPFPPSPPHPLTPTPPHLSLSSTALHADAPLDGFARLNQACDWAEFSTAVSHIHAPSLNLLYADDQGNIGYWVTGRVPVRGQGDGRSPAPGHDPAYDWIGHIPPADMPHALNPAAGFIVSANHKIVDEADYPHYLGRIWRDGYRARRLEQLIRGEAGSPLNAAQPNSLLPCPHHPHHPHTPHPPHPPPSAVKPPPPTAAAFRWTCSACPPWKWPRDWSICGPRRPTLPSPSTCCAAGTAVSSPNPPPPPSTKSSWSSSPRPSCSPASARTLCTASSA